MPFLSVHAFRDEPERECQLADSEDEHILEENARERWPEEDEPAGAASIIPTPKIRGMKVDLNVR
jgi:hypothetical protein